MAQQQRERQAYGGATLQKSGFVTLGSAAPKRTKAGSKLAVPRPVNLPSLKKENAVNEASASGGGAAGWSSGGDATAADDSYRNADSSAGASSSLVEKASWAGQSSPAMQAQPAPWEQPRGLNLREFPSLAAAAAVPQHPAHPHRPGSSAAAAESGAWDEDERGRGPTGAGQPQSTDRGRSREGGRPPLYEDGYGGGYSRGPPPFYGRHRGDLSPPREHRRFDGDEPPYSRYGGAPQHGGYHGGGGHAGWRDDSCDWQRHDRFDGPPSRHTRHGVPPRDHGRRYGRPHPDNEADFHEPQPPRDRHYAVGRLERSPMGAEPRDPSLFPPPPAREFGRERGMDGDPAEGRPAVRGEADFQDRPHSTGEQRMQPPPPPPRKESPQQPAPAQADRPDSAGKRHVEQPVASMQPETAVKSPVVQPLLEDPAAASAPQATLLQSPSQQHSAAATVADRKVGNAPSLECQAAAAAEPQASGGKAGPRREAAAAPPPPPPPAIPKPPPPPQQPLRSSAVKPGLSWKALVAGVPDEPVAPASSLVPFSGDAGDASDKTASRDGKRSRGKKQEGKKEAAAPAAQQPAVATAAPTAAAKQQRSKRATRGKKGSGQAAEDGVQQQEAAGDTASATSSGSKGQAARSRGRGRGKDGGEQLSASSAAEGAEGLAAGELAAELVLEAVAAPPAAEPLPADVPEMLSTAVGNSLPHGLVAAAVVGTAAGAQPEVPPLQTAPAIGAATATSTGMAPIMPAAFGWSSPLADEVAKLQLTAGGSAAQQDASLVAPLAPAAGDQLVANHMALLPTLGRDLREPSTLLQPTQRQQQDVLPMAVVPAAAPGIPSSADRMADVITSLPADLTLDLGAAAPGVPGVLASGNATSGTAPPASVPVGQPFASPSPPPPSASPPPFPGGLFPATSSSWQAQPPSKEAVQLFEGVVATPGFNFGSIASHHMQFGAVAAAFGQQQQPLGPGGGVDWSSPAPSPPPFVGAGLAPAAVFGRNAMSAPMQYGHPMQLPPPPGLSMGGPGAPYAGPPQHQLPQQRPPNPVQLEDPAAALPDDVFDVPIALPPQQQHIGGQQGQANGQGPRGRVFPNRNSRGRNTRYPQPQLPQQHSSGYGQQHGGYPPAGAAFPPHMAGWPSSQAPHFLPPQLVGPRQQQGSSGRGRGRGRNSQGGNRSNTGGRQMKPAPPQQQQ